MQASHLHRNKYDHDSPGQIIPYGGEQQEIMNDALARLRGYVPGQSNGPERYQVVKDHRCLGAGGL